MTATRPSRPSTLQALFTSSRPISWVNTAFPFGAAYLLGTDVFGSALGVVTFVVGASAFSGDGPAVGGQGSSSASVGLSDMLVGVLLLAIAVFAPWLTFRFVHWSGMEAASVMHETVAANDRLAIALGRDVVAAVDEDMLRHLRQRVYRAGQCP